MWMIKKVSDEIRGNIHEAREKINKAYKLRDENRSVAEWYKEMASAHIGFNSTGHSVVTRLIDEAKVHMHDNPMMPGMIAAYNEIHADLIRESAEVQAMIQNFK